MKKTFISLMLTSIGALSACSEVALTDVSEAPDFRPIVGTQYEIVGAVDAYGIRQHSKAEVEYITLIPPPGIAGSEVGFRIPVELGSKMTIDKVMRTNIWFSSRDAFIVTLEGTSMPTTTVIRVEMNRGNEGNARLQLNPDIYRKIRRGRIGDGGN